MTLDPTSRLPPELVTIVLDWLGQPDVLRAARISRCWRAFATGHPSFYAYLMYERRHVYQPPPVDSFCFAVAYAVERNVRINVRAVLDFGLDFVHTNVWVSTALQVLRSLRQACPLIICLTLDARGVTQGPVREALDDVLQQPLPVLEVMDLVLSPSYPPALPANFLCGHSSRLRTLSLSGCDLKSTPSGGVYTIPHLSTLVIKYTSCALLDIATRFPGLVELSCLYTEFTPSDFVGLHVLFPRLKHLHVRRDFFDARLPWTSAERTAHIPSLTIEPPVNQLEFEEIALPLVRCIQAPARLDVLQSGHAHELRFEGGGFKRTFIRVLGFDYKLYRLGLEGLIAQIGGRITHICVNWQCLRYYVNPTSSIGLTAVRRMEVDLTGLVRKRDCIFDYDVHRRRTTTAEIDIEWFDLDASSFQDSMPQNKDDTSSIDFVLSSPTGRPIWLCAPKVLALAQRLGLHHLARKISIVLVHGVVIEPEDVALLLTVFVDVTNSCNCTDCIHEDYTIPV